MTVLLITKGVDSISEINMPELSKYCCSANNLTKVNKDNKIKNT